MSEIFLDTETTGLSFKDGHKIVEIACIESKDLISTGKVFHKLINPERTVPEEAFKIHGFSEKFLSEKETFNEIADEFLNFIQGKKIIIHNASFDFKFLLSDVKRLKGQAPKGPVLDTLSLARKVFPGMANYKLWTLVRHFDFPSGTFHRAEEDSMYCGLLFAKIVETIELRGEEASVEHLSSLVGKEAFQFPQFDAASDQMDLF